MELKPLQRKAIAFIDDVHSAGSFRVQVVQTEDVAEFQSHFHWRLKALDIRTPTEKSNGHTESTTRSSSAVGPGRERHRRPRTSQESIGGEGGNRAKRGASRATPGSRPAPPDERSEDGGEGGNRTHPPAQSAEATILKTVTTTRHVSLSTFYPTVHRAASEASYTTDTPGNPVSTSPMTAAR